MAIDCSFWDNIAEYFLAGDRDNPSRAAAAGLILDHAHATGRRSLVEIGPGMGFDYADRFLPHVSPGHIQYAGIEGSRGRYERLRHLYPSGNWIHGTFDDLLPNSYDIAYTKATLEHQPSLLQPLVAMLRATRSLAVINWYRPPGDHEEQNYRPEQRVWYTTWKRTEVFDIIASFGSCKVKEVEGSTNIIYVVTRSSQ